MVTKNTQQFRSIIFDSIPVAIVTMDLDFNITSFNRRAEELTGYSALEAVGQPCNKILHSSRCENGCPLKTVQNLMEPATGLEAEFINNYGEHIPVRISTASIGKSESRYTGYLEVIEDISREKAHEREKNNFLFMVAHDMKSPLVAIQGLTSRLREHYKEMNSEQMEKYFKSINKAGQQIEAQVKEFLEYSRQAMSKIKLNEEDVNLEKIIDDLVSMHGPQALQKNIKIHSECNLTQRIKGDPIQLQRAFENLLDNALKFTNKHGEILFSTRETSKEIVIQVKDNGFGIDVDDLPYIFDAFHQSKSSRSGYGLGLAAVKAIVQEHGGRVSVESSLGKGSVFTLRLPKQKSPQLFSRHKE